MNRIVKLCGVALVVGMTVSSLWAGCGKCGQDSPDQTACAEKKECAVWTGAAWVNTEALATLIRAKVPMVILDARSGKFDDGRRLSGAKALSAEAEEADAGKVIPSKDSLVVTYCASWKCPASHALAERLKKLGYANVIEYRQGIEGWTKAGNSVEGGGK